MERGRDCAVNPKFLVGSHNKVIRMHGIPNLEYLGVTYKSFKIVKEFCCIMNISLRVRARGAVLFDQQADES